MRLGRVTHRYGRGGEAVTAVGPVDLTVPAGKFLVPAGARLRHLRRTPADDGGRGGGGP
ncbi:hypothetical protein [Streptomyces sp. 11x1]|uniref:hypothetical protein n=1 Tax=Streptomyces sp. 11x1 TaxID=3038642 RepID=UPI0037D9F137